MTDRPSRREDVDALRILGTCAIVVGHAAVLDRAALAAVYIWHVPLFFWLSGSLWRTDRPMREELRNRIRSLGVPYLCWLALVALVGTVCVTVRLWPGVRMPSARSIIWGGEHLSTPFNAFWFVSALLWGTLAYRLSRRWLAPRSCLLLWAAMATTALPVANALSALPLSLGATAYCTVFIAAGECCRAVTPSSGVTSLVAGCVLTGIPVALCWTGRVRPLDLKYGLLGTPLLSVLSAVACCLGLQILAAVIVGPSGKRLGLHRLAELALAVVLLHPLVLDFFVGSSTVVKWLSVVAAIVLTGGFAAAVKRGKRSSQLLLGAR